MESINLTAVNITDAEALRGVLVAMQAYMEEQRDAIDTGWTLLSVFIIFFMQIGFGFLEAGSVSRKRSAVAIIMQNGLVTLFTAMVWWLVGFAFAYGEVLLVLRFSFLNRPHIIVFLLSGKLTFSD